MKRKLLVMLVCLTLVLSTVIAPVSAYAGIVKIMKINTNARLRSGPGDYPWSKILKKGTKVLYAGRKSKAFCYVKTTDGSTGWVFRDFLSEYGAVNSSSIYKTNGKATVYSSPSTSSGKVKSLSKGAYVMVYATKGGWAYVRTTSGKGGYMQVSKLTK